jgi:hypothetical protein
MYNVQTSVSVDIVTPGKPDAKTVRLRGLFARLIGLNEDEATFWQFASNLNGDYANLGVMSNNRFVYFNPFAAKTFLASEKTKDLEVQAARFGHAHVSSQAPVIVGRRVISNKRFVASTANKQELPRAHSSPSTEAVNSSLGRVIEYAEEFPRDRSRLASVSRSDALLVQEKIDDDKWSDSSDE